MKKIIRNIAAVLLILIGVIGGFIPILQGWIFVLTGYIILDFKKKKQYEEKVLNILGKTKLGNRLLKLWFKAKNQNKDVIDHKNDKVREIIHSLNKDVKKK